MADVIYTGKGMQAPSVRGYALQALSQFGQQEQARKTMELEQGVKDRDTFAKMLEMDPVYASSKAAQDRVASIMDNFIDEMTIMNKKRVGPMSTQDLVKMQQARGRAMAEMQYIQGANDEFVQAAKEYNAAPWKYDDETWQDYQRTWLEEGVRPEGPPLLPAAQDPISVGLSNLAETGLRFEYSDVKRENVSDVEDRITQIGRYNIPDNVSVDDLISRSISPDQPWNIQKTFNSNKVSGAERAKYMSLSNGDEQAAAGLWYKDKMNEALMAERTKYKSMSARRDVISPVERENMKTRYSSDGGTYIYDNDAVFQKGVQNLAIGESGEGFAFLKPKLINIPVTDLKFTNDISFDKGSRIWVQPQQVVFKNGQIEYAVDPSKNGEVWITADSEEDVPLEEILDSEELPNGKVRYRGKLRALTALGKVEDNKSLIGFDFPEVYENWYNQWSKDYGKQPKKEESKKNRNFKWLNPATWFSGESEEAVFDINGEQYTESELRGGGWTDSDIAQLKRMQ